MNVVSSFQNSGADPITDRMGWFRHDRFGLFVHWGIYSLAAGKWEGRDIAGTGEWIMERGQIPATEYEQLAARFQAPRFNARHWVATAKRAGAKYLVVTTKHHDGFCLFDSKLSRYTAPNSPFARDAMKELTEAAAEEGIRICWYYSIMDWHHPDAQRSFWPKYNDSQRRNPTFARYVGHMKQQLHELLTKYGNIGILWFDGEWIADWNDLYGSELYDFCRSIQPALIINNRVGNGRKGMSGITTPGAFSGDYDTPEQEIPSTGIPGRDWESCMTMNDTWGFKESDQNWKSTAMLIRMLIDTASKGGNFLLNVGPTGDGEIPLPSLERLDAMGDWMVANGESIYGTGPSPIGEPPWGRCTQSPGKLFLHIFEPPRDGILQVPQTTSVSRVSMLGKPGQSLTFSAGDGCIRIRLPERFEHAAPVVVLIEEVCK